MTKWLITVSVNKNEKFPFLSLSMNRYGGWDLLAENFKDNSKLVEAVDIWLAKPENYVNEMEISAAAQIGRTPIAKKILLSLLDSHFRFWAVKGLLEGWGMQDEEVGPSLTKIAYGETKEASTIGHLLPQIIVDKNECRKRLVVLIEDKDCQRRDFVVWGLMKLGDLQQNPIVIDKIIEVLPNMNKYGIWQWHNR